MSRITRTDHSEQANPLTHTSESSGAFLRTVETVATVKRERVLCQRTWFRNTHVCVSHVSTDLQPERVDYIHYCWAAGHISHPVGGPAWAGKVACPTECPTVSYTTPVHLCNTPIELVIHLV